MNGALVAGGSLITLQSLAENSPIQFDFDAPARRQVGYIDNSGSIRQEGGVSIANITVRPNGYTPNYFQVKTASPVKINLTTVDGLGCTSVFRMPQLGITKSLTQNNTDSVEFTAPSNPTKLTFTCSMGMYRGVIDVI